MSAPDLDATFAALADPTRRAMLVQLAHGEASVGELARPFDFALPTISKHLRVLERARLIEKRKDAAQRRCRLRLEPLNQASQWISKYTSFWMSTLDSLEQFATSSETRPPPRTDRSRRKNGRRS